MTSNNPSKEYHGVFRAIVKNNKDPEELGRVKLQVPEIFGKNLTDWAWSIGSNYGGFTNGGDFKVPEINSGVYCMFEYGDPNLPLYLGAWFAKIEGVNQVPLRARGVRAGDVISAGKGHITSETIPFKSIDRDLDFETDIAKTIQEPSSPFEGEYPFVKIEKTLSGHVLEFDDTPDKERVLLYHRKGSFLEFRKQGDAVFKTKKRYDLIDGESIQHIRKHQVQVIEESKDITIKGQKKEVVKGLARTDYHKDRKIVVRGKYEHSIAGDNTIEVRGRTSALYRRAVKHDIISSLTQQIGAQFERTVTETSSESISNAQRAVIAKNLDILFGNYTIDIEEGSEKHTLMLGDVEWELVLGDESHLLTEGNVDYTLTDGDVLWTLIEGDWDTIITKGNESHSISEGDLDFSIRKGSESHTLASGSVSWEISEGSESHSIGTGDFILDILSGDIDMSTLSGSISIKATSGSISIISPTSVGIGPIGGVFSVPWADLTFPVFNSHVHLDPSNESVFTGIPTSSMAIGSHASTIVKTS